MGSDPPTQAVDMQHGTELDYAALDAEYRQLSTCIQALGAPAPTPQREQQLTIIAQVHSSSHTAAVLPHALYLQLMIVGVHTWAPLTYCSFVATNL